MPDALPEEGALNPTGSRLARKQERARISPGRMFPEQRPPFIPED